MTGDWIGVAAGAFLSLLFVVGLLGVVGYALLQLLLGDSLEAADFGTALGVGYSVVLPLAAAERALGWHLLIVPAWLLSAWWLRRRWRAIATGELLRALVLPAALVLLSLVANAGDIRFGPGTIAFRAGFDVSDRAFYGLVGQELLRALPPSLEHPLFSGVSFTYSFFPALLGVLLHAYAGAELLTTFMVYLPAVSFALIGITVDSLLREMGEASSWCRGLTALLLVLGGDLSFLVVTRNPTALERTGHFLSFHSFAAESLYYNTWALALPLVFVALTLASRWLREGRWGHLVLAGLVTGELWETKVFALLPLLGGLLAVSLVERRRRPLLLALVTAAFAIPWMTLTLLTGGEGRGAPLRFSLLYPVRMSLALVEGLQDLAGYAIPGAMPWPVRFAALGMATLVFLVGSFGARLIGLPRLVAASRAEEGLHRYVAASVGIAVLSSLVLVGNPVPTDAAQFLILAQCLAWLYAGPRLAKLFGDRRAAIRTLALFLVAGAVVNPVRYVIRKASPGMLTPVSAVYDRLFVQLSPDATSACKWLEEHAQPHERLLLPLSGDPGDIGGLKPLYVALVSKRRLAAYSADFSIDPAVATARRGAAGVVFDTEDRSEGESALRALAVRWVWQEDMVPLRFHSSRLTRRFSSGSVTLYEFSS